MPMFFQKDSLNSKNYDIFRYNLSSYITGKYEIFDTVVLDELVTDIVIKLINNKDFNLKFKSIGERYIKITTKFVVLDFLEKHNKDKQYLLQRKIVGKIEEGESEDFDFENLCSDVKEVNENDLGYYFFLKRLEKILDHNDFSILNYKLLGLTNIQIGKKMKMSDDKVGEEMKRIQKFLSTTLRKEDWI